MSKTNQFIALSLFSVFLCLTAYVGIFYYPYVFSKVVKGEVYNIEVAHDLPSSPYVIALRSDTAQIYTASSSDRQWSVVRQGQCAEARFFPSPPWKIEKAGTYIDVRLLKLWDCQGGQSLPHPTTVPLSGVGAGPGVEPTAIPSTPSAPQPSVTPIPGVGGEARE